MPPAEAASPFKTTADSSVAESDLSSAPSTPGGRPRHKRNSSVRIRSASDTSSSDTDDDRQPHVASGEPTLRFPAAATSVAASSSESLPGTAAPQTIRRKVLSNASSEGGSGRSLAADQALARVKATPDPAGGEKAVKAPSSWERFQRPGAPSRSARRKKSGSQAASSSGMGGGTSDAGSDHEGQVSAVAPVGPVGIPLRWLNRCRCFQPCRAVSIRPSQRMTEVQAPFVNATGPATGRPSSAPARAPNRPTSRPRPRRRHMRPSPTMATQHLSGTTNSPPRARCPTHYP